MGEGLAEGIFGGLANMPPWVWIFIVFAIVFLMHPWESIQGIPRWAWIVVVILAGWVLITGK